MSKEKLHNRIEKPEFTKELNTIYDRTAIRWLFIPYLPVVHERKIGLPSPLPHQTLIPIQTIQYYIRNERGEYVDQEMSATSLYPSQILDQKWASDIELEMDIAYSERGVGTIKALTGISDVEQIKLVESLLLPEEPIPAVQLLSYLNTTAKNNIEKQGLDKSTKSILHAAREEMIAKTNTFIQWATDLLNIGEYEVGKGRNNKEGRTVMSNLERDLAYSLGRKLKFEDTIYVRENPEDKIGDILERLVTALSPKDDPEYQEYLKAKKAKANKV